MWLTWLATVYALPYFLAAVLAAWFVHLAAALFRRKPEPETVPMSRRDALFFRNSAASLREEIVDMDSVGRQIERERGQVRKLRGDEKVAAMVGLAELEDGWRKAEGAVAEHRAALVTAGIDLSDVPVPSLAEGLPLDGECPGCGAPADAWVCPFCRYDFTAHPL